MSRWAARPRPAGRRWVTVRPPTRLDGRNPLPADGDRETLRFVTCMLGYATASAVGQNLEGQLTALTDAGVDPRRVFTDTVSDSADRIRAGLHAMLSYARTGDTVIVVALDRLGRTTAEVTRTIAHLTERESGCGPSRRVGHRHHDRACGRQHHHDAGRAGLRDCAQIVKSR